MTITLTLRTGLGRPLTSLEADANLEILRDAILAIGDPDGDSGIAEAPLDGQSYVRRAGAWVVASGGGFADAPATGGPYGRQAGGWVALGGGGGSSSRIEAPAWDSGTTYAAGDVVKTDAGGFDAFWVTAYENTNQEPALGSNYWGPLMFGGGLTSAPSTAFLYHDDGGVQRSIAEMFASLAYRIQQLEQAG